MRKAHNFIDLTGVRFDRLLVIRQLEHKVRAGRARTCWECLCDCGKVLPVLQENLKSKHSTSCGCKKIERAKATLIDLTGMKFSRLLVIKRAENTKRTNARWECECDCGNTSYVAGTDLRKGHIRSCGCLQVEFAKGGSQNRQHGFSRNGPFNTWKNMIRRCTDPNNEAYHNYGGRGITVCDKWLKVEGFMEDMRSTFVEGLTIERIDNEKGYFKENCKWATRHEQAINKRNTPFVEFNGKKEKLIELRRKFNVTKSQYEGRIKMGYSVEGALTKGGK